MAIRTIEEDLMELDYDTGIKDGDDRRQSRYVFLRVGEVVVR